MVEPSRGIDTWSCVLHMTPEHVLLSFCCYIPHYAAKPFPQVFIGYNLNLVLKLLLCLVIIAYKKLSLKNYCESIEIFVDQ